MGDFSDDELSQVLKMQPKIKKEPEEDNPTTTSEMETNAAESSTGDSKVPEDVSLNTPKSNPEDMDDEDDDDKEESEAPRKKSTETSAAAAAASSNADEEATKDEGGELEGS